MSTPEVISEERKKYLEVLQKVGNGLLRRKIIDEVLVELKVETEDSEDIIVMKVNRAHFNILAYDISKMNPNQLATVEMDDVKKACADILIEYLKSYLY